MVNYFQTSLPDLALPLTRAAYSDRTAWLMAEMSALAYFKFEGEDTLEQKIQNITQGIKTAYKIKNFFTKNKNKKVLKRIDELEITLKKLIHEKTNANESKEVSSVSSTLEIKRDGITAIEFSPSMEKFQEHLKKADFELLKTFNLNDTQAFLARRESDKTAVLVFRGTEANKWKDIKTDLEAWTKNSSDGTKIHTGFANAYNYISSEVESSVSEYCKQLSLYIAGHSLGGALAIIAAKELEKTDVQIAACYTFGSPRVGNEELGEKIKAPVYRVVHAADGVPRVPPSWLINLIIIPILRLMHLNHAADFMHKRFSGYTHFGDMRYLTACNSTMSDLKLLENPSLPKKLRRLCLRWAANGWKIFGTDHKIDHYRNKLRHYAEQRNNKKQPPQPNGQNK